MELHFTNPYEEWLFLSERDLIGTTDLLALTHYDLTAYHAQQCAEKALKGFLSFKLHEVVKLHNLQTLLEICMKYDNSFIELRDNVLFLNELDTRFRYPPILFRPTKEAMEQALIETQGIFNFVQLKCV